MLLYFQRLRKSLNRTTRKEEKMATLTMKTHKAIKELVEAGIDEKQAEVIIDTVTSLQNTSAASKSDVENIIKTEIAPIKNDIDWIKKLMLGIGVAVVIASLKYIFIG